MVAYAANVVVNGRPVVPVRVAVAPEMLAWALERSGQDSQVLERTFPRLPQWRRGEAQPTIKQLETFARKTRTPVGYLLLDEPPDEPVPIPDYRTLGDGGVARPSPDLLDAVALCQLRQDWYRDHVSLTGGEPAAFVGSVTVDDEPVEVGRTIRTAAAFDVEDRKDFRSWTEALSAFSNRVEELGVLVMRSGVVGSNTHRRLDPDEFRGFALSDPIAPVIFINSRDTVAAQIFTLAHELAHLWLGGSALDSPELGLSQPSAAQPAPHGHIETWCNQVAAEILVPSESLQAQFDPTALLVDEVDRLVRLYRVSSLVVLRSLFDGGHVSWTAFREAWLTELDRMAARTGSDGGDYYRTQPVRVSKRFAQAVIVSTLEGHTLYRDAFRMLGFRKQSTFDEWSRQLGLA